MAGIDRPRVFLSYSRDDSDFVDELVISLESHGFEPVFDRGALVGGEEWEKRIRALISDADTTVALISDTFIPSDACQKELDIATEQGRRIIPVVDGDVLPPGTPELLSARHTVFFKGRSQSYARGVADLVHSLKTDGEWVKTQTTLASRATEWQQNKESSALHLRGDPLRRARSWIDGPRPRGVSVLPLVVDYIAASERGEASEEADKLKGQLRSATLGAVAALLVAGAASWFAYDQFGGRVQAEEDKEIAEDAKQRVDEGVRALGLNPQVLSDTAVDLSEEDRADVRPGDDTTTPGAPPSAAPRPNAPPPTTEDVTSPGSRSIGDREDRSILGLVSGLGSRDKGVRLRSGQEVAERLRGPQSDRVAAALVDTLNPERLDGLTANGRFNVLYMLNIVDSWPEGAARSSALSESLKRMRERAERTNNPIQIGPQTLDCIEKLERKLAGETGVPNRCGQS